MFINVVFLFLQWIATLLSQLTRSVAAYPGEFWGAFLASFFAFCFFITSSFFSTLFDRKRRHFNSLIHIQIEVTVTIESILWNLDELNRFKLAIDQSLKNKVTIPYIFQPRYISISMDVVRGIGANELLNQAISFFAQVETANMSLKSAKESSDSIRELYFQKTFDEAFITALQGSLSGQLEQMPKGKEMAEQLLAQARCELVFQKFWSFINRISFFAASQDARDEVYKRELKSVQDEVSRMHAN